MSASLAPWEGREYVCSPAGGADMAEIEGILRRTSMRGWARVIFMPGSGADSGPDRGGKLMVCVRKKDGACAAVYSMQLFHVHLGGEDRHCVYLGMLRVPPEFRGRKGIFRDGFASIPWFARQLGWPQSYFTSIAADNLPARRLLEAGLRDLPVYIPQGCLKTMFFTRACGRRRGLLQKADSALFPEIAAFYNRIKRNSAWSPVLGQDFLQAGSGLAPDDFYAAVSNGSIVACLALWDRRKVKRIIVEGYKAPLNIARPICNLWAALRRMPLLPPAGRIFDAAYLAFFALAPEMLPQAAEIVRDALFHARSRTDARVFMLGVAAQSPEYALLAALPHMEYSTIIESVQWGRQPAEICGLPQPEIAML